MPLLTLLASTASSGFDVDGALEVATKGTTHVLNIMFSNPILCAGLITGIVVSCAGAVLGLALRRGRH